MGSSCNPGQTGHPFSCLVCGAGFGDNPRSSKAIMGYEDFLGIGELCWVCARLRISAYQEGLKDGKELGERV